MNTHDANAPDDHEAFARRCWDAWSDALRRAAGEPAAGRPSREAGDKPPPADAGTDWNRALSWWDTLLGAAGAGRPANPDLENLLERFRRQAGEWFGTMQQVAARFTDRDATPKAVADAWREALGDKAEHLFAHMFETMRGPGMQGMDAWLEDMDRQLQRWRDGLAPWLRTPAMGAAREHQARWQGLAQAQQEYREQAHAYAVLMQQAVRRAFELFERKLGERQLPGTQLTSARALFDTWIDAAEEAYAETAMSAEFQRLYAQLTSAQLRLRAAMQGEVEQLSSVLGMPTRTEVDAAHRKIAELERRLRSLQAELDATRAGRRGNKGGDAPRTRAPRAAAAKPADARTSAKAAPARKPAPADKRTAGKAAGARKVTDAGSAAGTPRRGPRR